MARMWWLSVVLSTIAVVASVMRERVDDAATATTLAVAAIGVGFALTLALHIVHWRVTGSRYGGTNRFRIHVLTVGDLAIIMLALQFWIAGLALVLTTAVVFSHSIAEATEYRVLADERARGTSPHSLQ